MTGKGAGLVERLRASAKLHRQWDHWELGDTPVPDALDHGVTAVVEEQAADLITSQADEITRLREALTEISCPSQTLNLLWWQERARTALIGAQQP